MLAPHERILVRELLDLVPVSELISMATSITNKALQPTNKEDAIKVILRHELSYVTVLNRKRITKSTLIKYLYAKGFSCDSGTDKGVLIDMIMKYWKRKAPPKKEGSQEKKGDEACNKEKQNEDRRKKRDEDRRRERRDEDHRKEKRDEAEKAPHQALNIEEELGKQFTSWFYDRLNEDFQKKGGPIINEADFWPDCRTLIRIPETEESEGQDYVVTSAEESVNLIRSLRSQFDLFFSPNLNFDGVRAKTDPHGLVLVMAAGTLHSRAGGCVGLFEQTFGLIADPLRDNNYRIKTTDLVVKRRPSERTSQVQQDIVPSNS